MSKQTNGVLPAPSAITKRPHSSTGPMSRPVTRAPESKLKLILRRLPPGLTQTELENALGDEWKVGGTKVEWFAYKQGKISKDLAKPSHPSRAYFKVKDQSYITVLSDKIKQTSFQDAKNSSKDSCLLGPPSLEFAPYGRVPGSRLRKDGRQGTIDQEQEFIDFLHSLTEPVSKPTTHGETAENVDVKAEKVTTTPLIQFLKEKKANKSKEAAAAKAAKEKSRQEAKMQKIEKEKAEAEAKKATTTRKEANNAIMAEKQARIEKAKLEAQAAKVAQKQVAAIIAKKPTDSTPAQTPAQSTATAPSPATTPSPSPARRERERGNARAAAAILQRDLGLAGSPRADRRGARRNIANQPLEPAKTAPTVEANDKDSPSNTTSSTRPASQSTPKPSVSEPAASTTPTQAPTGPRNPAKPFNQPPARHPPNATPRAPPPKPTPQPSPGAKSAFLKHANPSQGVTEPLLHEAFGAFGAVTKCEIDKKKGFGYVDFADPEGLQKAMKNSPVKVGNGQVVVLERKDKTTPNKASFPNANKATPPSVATAATSSAPASAANVSTPPAAPATTTTTTTTSTPPTAPRGNATPTGPGRGGRGGMPPRGGFGRGGRGGFRGNRGGFHGPPRGGGTTSPAPAAAQPVASGEGK